METFFDAMNDFDPEKKLFDLHMFDGASVCRNAQNIIKVVNPMLSCIVGADHTCNDVFKRCAYIKGKKKLCIEDKVR